MDKSQPLLLALLAKQVRRLRHTDRDYAPVLEGANVQTPMKAWIARKELDKLCPSLTPLEIDSLAAAASQLTGTNYHS